jgi:endoglucanase
MGLDCSGARELGASPRREQGRQSMEELPTRHEIWPLDWTRLFTPLCFQGRDFRAKLEAAVRYGNLFALVVSTGALAVACGNSASPPQTWESGTSTGGATRIASGGTAAAGGTGGIATNGGSVTGQALGGQTAAGAAGTSSVAKSTGGATASGGQSTTGGAGGTGAIGGSSTGLASGGLTSSGGTAASSAATTTSGGTAVATGGRTAIGGAITGGAGGTVATGGNTSTGGATSTTPVFANDDQEILYDAVRFYGAERCGDNHNWTLVDNPAGHSCHMGDGQSANPTLDLTGGWHDAGDHVKVTLTIAYAAYIMLKAYEVYPTAFGDYDDPAYSGKPNGIPDVLDEARIGLDWLVKAHPDANTMVAMVANSDYDHTTFMTSPTASKNTVEKGGDPRPVQKTGKADFAGSAAAALALASRMYQSFDATQAALYMSKAKTAYAFAKANPGLSTSMLYAWTGMSYKDDLMCGAAELWRATSDSSYRSDAVSQNTSIGQTKSVPSYGQISDFCRHSLVKGGEQAALAPWTADVDRYTTLLSTDSNIKGLVYSDKWGTCRYAMAVAFSSALLYDVTNNAKYRDFARTQYAWIKGNNPQSRSFIIGWGTNPPAHPHHRNAYGYEDDVGWDADTPALDNTRPYHHLLVGALVGGPNLDGYEDTVNDYVHNEVAIDYNAGLVGTAAFSVVNR